MSDERNDQAETAAYVEFREASKEVHAAQDEHLAAYRAQKAALERVNAAEARYNRAVAMLHWQVQR